MGGKDIDSKFLDPTLCHILTFFLFCSPLFFVYLFGKLVLKNLAENICGASFATLQDDKLIYITKFMDHLISWDTVTLRMMRAESFVNLGEPNIPVA